MSKELEARELSMDELDQVIGGISVVERLASRADHSKAKAEAGSRVDQATGQPMKKAYCPVCHRTTDFIIFSGARARCTQCQTMQTE